MKINAFINDQIFSVITDRLTSSHAPKYFSLAINKGEITNDDIIIKKVEKVCVVSIALLEQEFTQRIQLSQVYDQKGRSFTIVIALTGH